MSIFLKCVSGVLVALILHIVLTKDGKDFSYILSLATSCTILFVVFEYMEPIIDFVTHIRELSGLDSEMLSAVLKSVGIGTLTEIVSSFCSDAGNAALGKTLHIVAAVLILLISIPLFESLIALVEEILITI